MNAPVQYVLTPTLSQTQRGSQYSDAEDQDEAQSRRSTRTAQNLNSGILP